MVMKSKLAMAAATIALSGLIPGSSRGAETSDSTNVNEPFLKQMRQMHAFETKGLAAVIHEEQSAASETQQAAELLAQREMTAQGQDLWQSCQTEVNGAPLWAMQKTGAGPLDPVWGYAMCNNVTQEIACPRKSGWDTRKPLPCRNPWSPDECCKSTNSEANCGHDPDDRRHGRRDGGD
jgi:hypothetical protein